MASRTHSRRCSVRMAAKTCVESVRCVPRTFTHPRALQVARRVSRNRWPASWASMRQRKSCNKVKSKPGSVKLRLRAYFQSLHAAADGIGRLAVGEPFDILHDHDER